ncbi:MAG: response regulator [Kiloniellaceae bacterium]
MNHVRRTPSPTPAPPHTDPAARERLGFGSTVVERTVPHELGGTASIDYATDGIQADIEKPGELVMVDSEERPEKVKKPVHSNPAKGLRLLIVEDNMILALDVEDMLMRNGAAQVQVVSSCEEALEQLDTTAFDAALLDLNLTRGDSLPVAMRLRERGIPFAFTTGYGERAIIPPPFATVPVIGKPYSESYLLARLAELLDRAD